MLVYVEGLLQKLELLYCILCLCGGDFGFIFVFIFDFEVYFVVQKCWLEVSFVFNFESFQVNCLKLCYCVDKGMELVYIFNGSVLVLVWIYVVILENN